MSVFLINGALAAIAGLLYAARLSAANPSQGIGLELDGYAARFWAARRLQAEREKYPAPS